MKKQLGSAPAANQTTRDHRDARAGTRAKPSVLESRATPRQTRNAGTTASGARLGRVRIAAETATPVASGAQRAVEMAASQAAIQNAVAGTSLIGSRD